MPVLTDLQVVLEAAHVLQGQGVEPNHARPRAIAVAEGVLDEAQALLTPAALYITIPLCNLQHHTVILEGGAVFEGSLVARALVGATEVALAVCTIGPALEEQVTALAAAGDLLRALALDGAGVAAAEQLSWMVGEHIREQALTRGLRIGMRASPGQEGWPIEQQRVLFDLVPAEKIGVRLTASCLMLPRKSISFALGLGPELRPDATACDFCSKRERCRWRRATETQHG
jgi:hypothetical protein